ncbi:MAG: PPOX class F420-dependent oxidoreductase [Dehalococcoidia bacterium]|nr:PPOX class F420-dependent oxidoreductase [Dehalococcoidia bacterium]
MTPAEIDAFLRQPLIAVISTVDEAGRPRSTPVWFHWEDGCAYLFTRRKSLKWRNLLARPYASLCVDQRTPPYAALVLDGPAEAVEDPPRLYELAGRMARAYYGESKGAAFAERYRDNPNTVLFRLRPERTVSWAYTEDE